MLLNVASAWDFYLSNHRESPHSAWLLEHGWWQAICWTNCSVHIITWMRVSVCICLHVLYMHLCHKSPSAALSTAAHWKHANSHTNKWKKLPIWWLGFRKGWLHFICVHRSFFSVVSCVCLSYLFCSVLIFLVRFCLFACIFLSGSLLSYQGQCSFANSGIFIFTDMELNNAV